MSFATLRRIVHALAILATVTVVGGWTLTLDAVRAALTPTGLMAVASALLVAPLCIHVAFLLLQGLPGGRRIVPIPLTRSPDAWLLVLVITLLGPKAQLVAWADPLWRAGETGRSVSLVTAVLAIAVRVYQLNRGAALGATKEAGPQPG